ncbi:MAG: endonuclease III [Bacilli bacterium]
MTRKEKVEFLTKYLNDLYPETVCFLHGEKDYEFLIAVLLSAQATDLSVNAVTPVLFNRYKTLSSLAEASADEVYKIIKSVGLGASKSKNIVNLAKKLISDFDGKVPNDRKSLESLPGVGHKTAAVFLAEKRGGAYIPVDTHIKRVSTRLGIARKNESTDKIEAILEKEYKGNNHINFHRQIILFGRNICMANAKRKCEICKLYFCKDRKTK